MIGQALSHYKILEKLIRTDGTDRRQLTDDLYKDRYPQWSPDGDKIAFYSNRSGSYDIWTINSDGSGLKQLTVTPGQSVNLPIWSPDGTHIAYFNRSLGRSYIFEAEKPWEAQTPQQLPALSDQQVKFEVTSWSPNGKRLAGYGSPTTGTAIGKIYTYSIESQKFEELSVFGYGPSWLDDHSLLFCDSRSVYMADLPSGNTRTLLSVTPDRIRYTMSTSEDKRWIYFTVAKMEADIWLLTLNQEQK